MNTVLLRNRPHYGAQITALPALFYFYKNYTNKSPLTLISKYELSWIYSEVEWINESKKSSSKIEELLFSFKSKNLLNLRPSYLLPITASRIFGKGKVFSLTNGNIISKIIPNQHHKLNNNTYRATSYLKIFIDSEEKILDEISSLFHNLKQKSNIDFQKNGINILIMPGGGAGEFKKWGIDNFIKCYQIISEKINGESHLHILLGPDEEKENQYLKNLKKEFNFSVHINLKIKDISKLIDSCELTIANDCGPSHIAQCLQKPYIGIFRKENPEWFLPHKNSIKITPTNGDNIKDIEINTIVDKAIYLLRNKEQ
ncbi:glycosyltransferase family 9 protein [Marinomonas sp. THO17]|uniref:glycosyltransferase family 9 protein n=1 Tax=Marinomonas sp. THO17 TaxID=3149048 RepID=UPI00336C1ADB